MSTGGGEPEARRRDGARLWFGLLGGAVAWLMHLLLAYVVAEFGCLAGLAEVSWFGVTLVAWLLIGVSVLMIALAAAATIVARRGGEAQADLGDTGVVTSGLFVFIIVVQSVPIFFYLSRC